MTVMHLAKRITTEAQDRMRRTYLKVNIAEKKRKIHTKVFNII